MGKGRTICNDYDDDVVVKFKFEYMSNEELCNDEIGTTTRTQGNENARGKIHQFVVFG